MSFMESIKVLPISAIPTSRNFTKVTSICGDAFHGCKKLEELDFSQFFSLSTIRGMVRLGPMMSLKTFSDPLKFVDMVVVPEKKSAGGFLSSSSDKKLPTLKKLVITRLMVQFKLVSDDILLLAEKTKKGRLEMGETRVEISG